MIWLLAAVALYIHQHGLSNAYDAASPINYFPVFVYGMYFFDLLQGTDANIYTT